MAFTLKKKYVPCAFLGPSKIYHHDGNFPVQTGVGIDFFYEKKAWDPKFCVLSTHWGKYFF